MPTFYQAPLSTSQDASARVSSSFPHSRLHTPGGVSQRPPQWTHQPSSNVFCRKCLFCSAPGHLILDCPIAEWYYYEGKVIQNGRGRYTLPNGQDPSHKIPGRNLRERIDNHFAAEQTQVIKANEAVAAHLCEVTEIPEEPSKSQAETSEFPPEGLHKYVIDTLTRNPLDSSSKDDLDVFSELWDLQCKIDDFLKAQLCVVQKREEA